MYKLISVDENTWAYEAVMDDGDTVRFFVLDGRDKCLVIDSGYLDIDIYGLVRNLLKDEGRDPDGTREILLANTHADMDHTGGNRSFEKFYISPVDYENCGVKQLCPDSVMIPAEEGTTIELGGRTLKYYTAPGHTYGNCVILDVTNRILFPGDIVQTGTMFMFGSHRCPEKMAESLKKLLTLKPDINKIYACHGKTILPPDAIDEAIKAWSMVLNKEVEPEPRVVFGTPVHLYRCGFCNFYCECDA